MGQVVFDTVTSLLALSLIIALLTGRRMYRDRKILEFLEASNVMIGVVHIVRMLLAMISDLGTLLIFQYMGINLNPLGCLLVCGLVYFVSNTMMGSYALLYGMKITYSLQSEKYGSPERYLKHIEEKAGELGGIQF